MILRSAIAFSSPSRIQEALPRVTPPYPGNGVYKLPPTASEGLIVVVGKMEERKEFVRIRKAIFFLFFLCTHKNNCLQFFFILSFHLHLCL
jgi:hypothetical protein